MRKYFIARPSLRGSVKRKGRRRIDRGTPAVPFSTDIRDAFIGNSHVVLSAVTLPLQHCQAKIQKTFRQFKLTTRYITKRQRGRKFWFLIMLASFFITGVHSNSGAKGTEETYRLPGSNHAIIAGMASNDLTRQHSYVDTVINASTQVGVPHVITNTDPRMVSREDHPRCFVADTDSVRFVLDTGANHTIVNDARHVYGYEPTRGKVKGINGKPTTSSGRGFIDIPLKSKDGRISLVEGVPVVHIPSCPHNLLPPQVLIKEMKARRFQVRHFKHDD